MATGKAMAAAVEPEAAEAAIAACLALFVAATTIMATAASVRAQAVAAACLVDACVGHTEVLVQSRRRGHQGPPRNPTRRRTLDRNIPHYRNQGRLLHRIPPASGLQSMGSYHESWKTDSGADFEQPNHSVTVTSGAGSMGLLSVDLAEGATEPDHKQRATGRKVAAARADHKLAISRRLVQERP